MFRFVLCFSLVSLIAAPQLASAEQRAVSSSKNVDIGFQNKSDLFEVLPGDKVRLEVTSSGKAMQWDVNYSNKQFRVCTKDVKPGTLTGMTRMQFQCRGTTKHQLWLQLNESSGEKYYKIITVEKASQKFDLPLADFTINKDKIVNGRLDQNQISRIVLLDFSALNGKTRGNRTLWFTDWKFTSQSSNSRVAKPAYAKKLSTGKVGMVCVPRNFQETEKRWLDFFTKAQENGVQVLSLQAGLWASKEKTKGAYNFKSWENFFTVLDKHGFQFELSKDIGGPFFLDKINVPKGIRFKSFTDPALLNRYTDFVTAYLDRFGDRHKYIVIHAEGSDAYFKKHPDQLNDYCQFLTEVKKSIQRQSPHIKVGVNADISTNAEVLSRLAFVTDFMAYDVLKGKVVRKPSDFESLVKRLTGISEGKKIALQNAGWSTSKTDKSSDEEQVEFIQEFYRVLEKYHKTIEYASFGSMYDHDTAITGPAYRAIFPDLPPQFVEKIIDSMSHFGMFRSDGSAKPAWNEFRKQVAAYYSAR